MSHHRGRRLLPPLVVVVGRLLMAIATLPASAQFAAAHPLIENDLAVVMYADRVVIDARVSPEEIALVDGSGDLEGATEEGLRLLSPLHAAYVASHLRIEADGVDIPGRASLVAPTKSDGGGSLRTGLVSYRVEYRLPRPPKRIRLTQIFLEEYEGWQAFCVLRYRTSTQTSYRLSLLNQNRPLDVDCDWPAAPQDASLAPQLVDELGAATAVPAGADSSNVAIPVTIDPLTTAWQFAGHGVMHILTGYDHLLFVAALILAARRIWDLILVVTAFTLAHTATLALSVFHLVRVESRIVEPMIAVSIVFIALENLIRPQQGSSRARLVVAFVFGLFHGLGFAGGLRETMAELPPVALWLGLVSFSLGVEIGHQLVVLPLFGTLHLTEHARAAEPRKALRDRLQQIGSFAVSLGGLYFLYHSLFPA